MFGAVLKKVTVEEGWSLEKQDAKITLKIIFIVILNAQSSYCVILYSAFTLLLNISSNLCITKGSALLFYTFSL